MLQNVYKNVPNMALKNVNKTHCLSSETAPFRMFFFRNGAKILPKRVNKQLRPNIQIACLTYSC